MLLSHCDIRDEIVESGSLCVGGVGIHSARIKQKGGNFGGDLQAPRRGSCATVSRESEPVNQRADM